MLIRENYLSKIRPFYDKDIIKVITGIRRSGKSILLKQIMDELKENGIDESQIIYLNFEYEDLSFIKNDQDLNEFIKSKIITKNRYYLFFDEIQNITSWEKAINSFKASLNVSIFITGSNSDLLSGELATHLAGRYVSFNVLPFTFKEVCEYKDLNNRLDIENAFNDYIKWGGMPQRFMFNGEDEIRTYLSDLYDSIIIKDIVNRFNIKDLDLFTRLIEYLVTTPSQYFSAQNISNYLLGTENLKLSKTTLYNYLEYMSKAMLINKVPKYDVRGKKILNGKYKYYLTDLGLGRIKSMDKKEQLGAYLENIVFNELLSRGYDVKIGDLNNAEIDFIATNSNEKLYVQVTYILVNETTINREFGAFKNIHDNYPKYVLSMDNFDFSQNGIIHKNIINWLLDK